VELVCTDRRLWHGGLADHQRGSWTATVSTPARWNAAAGVILSGALILSVLPRIASWSGPVLGTGGRICVALVALACVDRGMWAARAVRRSADSF
jgi:hypothetical protein